MKNQVKFYLPEIKGRAGDIQSIIVEFQKKCYCCVHIRKDKKPYERVCDRFTKKLIYGVVLTEDMTDIIVSFREDEKPHLDNTDNVGQIWFQVTIVKDGDNQTPDPEPSPVPTKEDLGNYRYSIGLLTDTHICKNNNTLPEEDTGQNISSSQKNWGDEKDFTRSLDLFVLDKNVKCLMSSGDIAEAQTNDVRKHPEATCDADYAEVVDIYNVQYWQKQGLRLFSPLGNHDFKGLFESRYGDKITGQKNTECIAGYNSNVNERISKLWPTGQKINSIVPGRGRIVFELEKGKTSASGQADMNFFAYNAFVDLYKAQSGYGDASVWDSKKNGISDKALTTTRNYVNYHWNECKYNLSGWYQDGLHGRNGYSKLNYWLKKDNDIFIHLSVDYGDDKWGVNDKWHARMVRARTLIDLKSNDPYVRRLLEYVADTGYSKADEPYNYQYYSVNSLIWLLEIVENNQDKKLFGFTHHFLPSRSGNGAGCPKDGNWQYADIHHYDEKDPQENCIYAMGSNALTGITYWFFDKLLKQHKNLIIFTGHSHISWESGINFDNHAYDIIMPIQKNKYVYTKISEYPIAETGWTVALPSMSKPRNIVDGQSVDKYQDAEMAIMELYDKGVIIKGYKVRENNNNINKLIVEKVIKLL